MSVTVIPTFRYANARAAIDWLCNAFGFEVHALHADGDVVHHSQLTLGGTHVAMIGTVRDDAFGQHQKPPVDGINTCSPYIIVDDPDAIHATAVAAGAEIVMPIVDHDYGGRGFTARDPEGVLWSFGSYRPD